jgi:menaquinone-dependent protoporphyrinogen IX oxidase
MSTIYIPYGTTEGQTAKIAEFIADVFRAHGHDATAADIKDAGDSLPDGCDAVLVGGSVHVGKHEKYVADFVRKNRETLERLPSALFSVSMAAHGDTGAFQRRHPLHPVRLHQAAHHEADRQQPGLHGHRHVPGLRLHGVGRREAFR